MEASSDEQPVQCSSAPPTSTDSRTFVQGRLSGRGLPVRAQSPWGQTASELPQKANKECL